MLKINKQINKLPNEIQLLILNFYNYKKEYFVKKVLPNILLINRINNYYDKDEFIWEIKFIITEYYFFQI